MAKIKINNHDNIFFTADMHFGHKNIITYANRPFKDVEQMNEELIARWNNKVPKHATVFHLGDFTFADEDFAAYVLNRLNGYIINVTGNHDHKKVLPLFQENHDLIILDVLDRKQPMVMCHYPMLQWDRGHYGAWMLHGHCHGTMKYPHPAKIMDVGIDCHANYEPFNFDEVEFHIKTKPIGVVDHHAITAYRENAKLQGDK